MKFANTIAVAALMTIAAFEKFESLFKAFGVATPSA